ncbi:hypothetical protein D3C71_1330910 [compost metagenome]
MLASSQAMSAAGVIEPVGLLGLHRYSRPALTFAAAAAIARTSCAPSARSGTLATVAPRAAARSPSASKVGSATTSPAVAEVHNTAARFKGSLEPGYSRT